MRNTCCAESLAIVRASAARVGVRSSRRARAARVVSSTGTCCADGRRAKVCTR